MKEVLKYLAPIEKVFRSVEGESSRVGEITSFLKLGDGSYQGIPESLVRLTELGEVQTCVIQTSNIIHLDWRPFVENWVVEAAQVFLKLVHETRGDLLGPKIPTYVWLTPGVTTITPADLNPKTDEVKVLVNFPNEIGNAVKVLKPWAEAGYQCFLFPRVKADHAAFFQCFLMRPTTPNIRMMLLEHEVSGIE